VLSRIEYLYRSLTNLREFTVSELMQVREILMRKLLAASSWLAKTIVPKLRNLLIRFGVLE
jgi:hypothetical protein